MLASIMAYNKRYLYIVYLAIGPLISTCIYVVANGLSEPAWMTFMAINTIGMFVSVVVTCAMYACSWVDRNRKGNRKGDRTI